MSIRSTLIRLPTKRDVRRTARIDAAHEAKEWSRRTSFRDHFLALSPFPPTIARRFFAFTSSQRRGFIPAVLTIFKIAPVRTRIYWWHKSLPQCLRVWMF